ncbi:hypothetical protein Tco_0536776 [Tanacetum coccineum]
MLDYGFNFMNTKIYIDNESTICIVKNLVFHSKTKHIAIRHHFIRDAYEKKLIQVLKIHTDDNVADLLTKAFDVSRSQFLVVTIRMINPEAALVKGRQMAVLYRFKRLRLVVTTTKGVRFGFGSVHDKGVIGLCKKPNKGAFWLTATTKGAFGSHHHLDVGFGCAPPQGRRLALSHHHHREIEIVIELGIGDGDDVRDHVEIDPRDVRDDIEEYEADTSAGDTVEVGIDPMSAPIVEEEIVKPAGEESSDSSGTRDDVVRDFYHHMSEVRIDRIFGIECVQIWLEADQLIARGQRVSMIKRIDSLRLENLNVHAMLDIERGRVNSLHLHMSLSQEEFRQVRRDRDDTRERLRRTMTNTRSGMTSAAIEEMINQCVDAALEARRVNRDLELGNGNDNGGDGNGNGTGNGNNRGDNGDGNENRNVNGRGDRPVARDCTYQDFMKCQPLGFKGTEGVVSLIRWSEKMVRSLWEKKQQVTYMSS